jgi:hypothetical protein
VCDEQCAARRCSHPSSDAAPDLQVEVNAPGTAKITLRLPANSCSVVSASVLAGQASVLRMVSSKFLGRDSPAVSGMAEEVSLLGLVFVGEEWRELPVSSPVCSVPRRLRPPVPRDEG